MVLVVRKQCLRALGPEGLHRVLGLAAVVPLYEAHQDLVGLAGLDRIGLGLFDDAHNMRHFGLPAAFGEDEGRLLRVGAIGLALATVLLGHDRRRGLEGFRGCALLGALLSLLC